MEYPTNRMYSPEIYLKDILENIDETEYYDSTDEIETAQWNVFKGYWYFSEIGFDFTEIFLQRLKAKFSPIAKNYRSLFAMEFIGNNETFTADNSDKRTPNLNSVKTQQDSGNTTDHYDYNTSKDETTFTYGKTDTVTPNLTTNTSRKERASQSFLEDVTNSGNSVSQLGGTDVESRERESTTDYTRTHGKKVETNNTETGNETIDYKKSETRKFDSFNPDSINTYISMRPMAIEFCLQFSSLFMEVF